MKKPTQMLLKKKLEMNLAGESTSLCGGRRCGLRVGMCTISGSSELESAIGEVRERCPSCREEGRRRLWSEGKGGMGGGTTVLVVFSLLTVGEAF